MKLPVVSIEEMRRIEEQTFDCGVKAEDLMEEVGRSIAQTVVQYCPHPGIAEVYYGKGHNGGDALVAARHLVMAGWQAVLLPQEKDAEKLAPLTRKKLDEFEMSFTDHAPKVAALAEGRLRPFSWVILDGLLGLGASGPLREDIRALTRRINADRVGFNAQVFAVDLPTGLDGETGEADPDCVVADFTIAAGYAKTGLVADKAPSHVGRLCIAPLHEFEVFVPAGWGEIAAPASLAGLLPRRNFDSHKTQYGRVGIVAGSLGFTGAATLCANGALRGGAGLVTVYATPDCHPIIAAQAPPEVMVRPISEYTEILNEKHDVIGLGPGLGLRDGDDILELIEKCACPMVVDADGLNLVAKKGVELLNRCAGPRLLTPHPGEMARLFPDSKNLSRRETVERFAAQFPEPRHPVTLLLKGSRTLVHEAGRPCSFNTTGNPGMGTGGMGDVLTGVCAALIGQRLTAYDAARVGAWLCGRAAELAVSNGDRSEESLSAMDVAGHLGSAFGQLREESL